MLIRSWVASANRAETDFPLNNLPCGVFAFGDDEPHCGVAIGDMILDVTALEEVGIKAVLFLHLGNECDDLGILREGRFLALAASIGGCGQQGGCDEDGGNERLAQERSPDNQWACQRVAAASKARACGSGGP